MSYLIQDMLAELPVEELQKIKDFIEELIKEKIDEMHENEN